MQTEGQELCEGIAESWADMLVAFVRVLMQVYVRVQQNMPFEEWFDAYLEGQGYMQEEFLKRMTMAMEELRGLSPDDTIFCFSMILKNLPDKLERLEIPEAVKEFLRKLISLIKLPIVSQSEEELPPTSS